MLGEIRLLYITSPLLSLFLFSIPLPIPICGAPASALAVLQPLRCLLLGNVWGCRLLDAQLGGGVAVPALSAEPASRETASSPNRIAIAAPRPAPLARRTFDFPHPCRRRRHHHYPSSRPMASRLCVLQVSRLRLGLFLLPPPTPLPLLWPRTLRFIRFIVLVLVLSCSCFPCRMEVKTLIVRAFYFVCQRTHSSFAADAAAKRLTTVVAARR